MSTRRSLRCIGAGVLLALSVGGGLAETLTIGVRTGPSSLDPHDPQARSDGAALRHIFDTLVWSGDKLQLEPGLAESWKIIDATTWEFRLRQGVRFHDGSNFTAEDVKASIERARTISSTDPSASPARRIKAVNVVDPRTLHILTDRPTPTLLHDLADLLILSAKESISPRAAIGTGPFKVVSWTPNKELVMERFDQHWRGASSWQRVVRREIPVAMDRVALLKAGQVDVIDQVPAAELATLEKDPKLRIVTAGATAIFDLEFDLRERTPQVRAKDGSPFIQNPFRDPRVREAVDLAVDRRALAEVALEGLGRAQSQVVTPETAGFNAKLPDTRPNLQRARQLLQEAGFPNGFKVSLDFTSDHTPGDRALGASVAHMLGRIGLEVQPNPRPAAVFFPARDQGAYSLVLAARRPPGGDAFETLSSLGHTRDPERQRGALNWRSYSNPALDRLLDQAAVELDEGKRRQLLEEAGALFARERVCLPLVALAATWALRKDKVDLPKPRADGETLAQDLVPARK